MRIKSKIALGVGFFFAMLVLITTLSIWSLYLLRREAAEVLKDNYHTLTHVEVMRQALDLSLTTENGPALEKDSFIQIFASALGEQEKNITEQGEEAATGELRQSFEQYKQQPGLEAATEIHRHLYDIGQLNLQAIIRKNDHAAAKADQIIALLSLLGTLLLLISFTLIINFPGYIADPIVQLTAGIRQIADKHYGERLHFKSSDEFGEVAAAFNEMAGRLDDYEHSNLAQLVFEKKRMDTLIANLNDAVVGFDENNRIIFANTVATNLLGLSEKDLLGQYAPDVALHNDLLRNILQENTEPSLKIFADGKESYFTLENVAVTVLHNREKREAGRVLLLKNVTLFKELDLAKTNFIATISHELKTPLAAIKMSLKLLEDHRIGPLNLEQQKLVDQIHRDSGRLLRLTSELLDLAQVETGNLYLTQTVTDPGLLLEYAVQAVEASRAEKKIRFDLQVASDLPMLTVDPEKTAWVLVNLFSNAIKHSPEEAAVEARIFRQGNEVCFTVRDFGKGIEEKYQQRLFERYFRTPSNGGPGKTGTGLGLAISKSFIEAQGGRIWVESKPGQGALFGVSLPVNG